MEKIVLWQPSSSSSSINTTSWNLEDMTHFGAKYFSPKYKRRGSDNKEYKAGQ